jgi:hypothetical protein
MTLRGFDQLKITQNGKPALRGASRDLYELASSRESEKARFNLLHDFIAKAEDRNFALDMPAVFARLAIDNEAKAIQILAITLIEANYAVDLSKVYDYTLNYLHKRLLPEEEKKAKHLADPYGDVKTKLHALEEYFRYEDSESHPLRGMKVLLAYSGIHKKKAQQNGHGFNSK